MSDFFRGKHRVKVLRPKYDRDMHGDRLPKRDIHGDPISTEDEIADEFDVHYEDGCFISYTTAWAPPQEVKKFPISAVDRDVTLYFDRVPDITMNDFIHLSYNNYRYRVIVVDVYESSKFDGRVGCSVRMSALETEQRNG